MNFLNLYGRQVIRYETSNNFLLIDATDRSKISSDQKRFFIALRQYLLSFFANTPFNSLKNDHKIPKNQINIKHIIQILQPIVIDYLSPHISLALDFRTLLENMKMSSSFAIYVLHKGTLHNV